MSRFISTRLAQPGILPVAVRIFSVHICFAILLATSVLGQTAESPPAFEAASIKLNTGSASYYNDGPGQFEMRNYPLIVLIYKIYGVNNYSLSGPDWLGSVKVDLVAKLPASAAGQSVKDRRAWRRSCCRVCRPSVSS
jgi:hypothetical protein